MWSKIGGLAVLLALLAGCTDDGETGQETLSTLNGFPTPVLAVEVIEQLPHDETSFTQGLLVDGPTMYESVGGYGSSALIELQGSPPSEGTAAPPGYTAVRRTPVDEAYFAEGLALVDARLVQLTWKEGTALVYDV